MSGFFENLLTDAARGFFSNEVLRDYTHASKTFRPNAYQYAPKFKFLFHVYFETNPTAYAVGLPQGVNFGLAVKSAKLPNYTFDTHTMNQYNRKRIVQTKIKYDPIDITFHDDNGGSTTDPTAGGAIRNMWYNYYTYYYKDASKPVVTVSGNNVSSDALGTGNGTNNATYNERNIYAPSITGNTDWGYVGESSNTVNGYTEASTGQTKIPFFKNITIFGFNQHNYVAYTLINPIITRFAHDTYNYAEGNGTMENSMTLDYETVKYFQGAINGDQPSNIVAGFGLNNHYDRVLSPIARPGSNKTILGQGGLIDAGQGIIGDLSGTLTVDKALNAARTAGITYNTFKNLNLKQAVKDEVTKGITNAIMNPTNNTGRNVRFNLPIFGNTPNQYQQANGRNVVPPPINR